MKIVALNGPRTVGKTFIAKKFVEVAQSARILPIMWPWKMQMLRSVGLPSSAAPIFEHSKDVPSDQLGGQTPREFYIEMGNQCREREGQNVFIDAWVAASKTYRGYRHLVVPDCRFQRELDGLVRLVGSHRVLLIRVARKGRKWGGDLGETLAHEYEYDMVNMIGKQYLGQEVNMVVENTI